MCHPVMKARMWWLRQILDAALVEIHRLMIEASLDVYALLVAHLTQAVAVLGSIFWGLAIG
jgi:hypothetical protein